MINASPPGTSPNGGLRRADEGLGGMGAAAAEIFTGFARCPEANPNPVFDLRRFIRCGDILNYLGGNKWGHIVLILGTPTAKEVPVLFDMERVDPVTNGRFIVELARDVPVYLCNVLQSASNMQDINTTSCAFVVHPQTQQICAVKEISRGVQLSAGREGPVTCQILMSPFNNANLDIPNFRLAVEEVHRAAQDTKWSFRTAIRGYLRSAALRVSKYRSVYGKRQLANLMEEKWRKRPVCSTVPPRVWQKYFLKACIKHRDYMQNGSDPELAWVEAVLAFMPVKDDRVLPKELVRILLGTKRWQEISFRNGPPKQRLVDPPIKAKPQIRTKRQLPPGQPNAEGACCWIGQDQFSVYCGRQVEKPKQIEGRLGHSVKVQKIDWDGKCGPMSGPQCAACRQLQDRLIA